MYRIASYSSSDSDSSDTPLHTLSEVDVRSLYLVTFSQAALEKFSCRREFANAVVQGFSKSKARVLQWCCCREKQQRGGEHYHLALKLNRNQRWLAAKEYLLDTYGISVHFSNRHHNYYSAWCYVTKCDESFEQSELYPDISNSSRLQTSAASVTKRLTKREREERKAIQSSEEEGEGEEVEAGGSHGKRSKSRKTHRKHLTDFEVSQIIVNKNVKTVTELQALACEEKQEGKADLAEFLISHIPRVVSDVLNSAWEIEIASQKLERSKKTRIE